MTLTEMLDISILHTSYNFPVFSRIMFLPTTASARVIYYNIVHLYCRRDKIILWSIHPRDRFVSASRAQPVNTQITKRNLIVMHTHIIIIIIVPDRKRYAYVRV